MVQGLRAVHLERERTGPLQPGAAEWLREEILLLPCRVTSSLSRRRAWPGAARVVPEQTEDSPELKGLPEPEPVRWPEFQGSLPGRARSEVPSP